MHRAHLSPGHCLSNGSHYVVEKSADQMAMYHHQNSHPSRRSYPLLVVAAVVAFKSLARATFVLDLTRVGGLRGHCQTLSLLDPRPEL